MRGGELDLGLRLVVCRGKAKVVTIVLRRGYMGVDLKRIFS